MDIDVQVDVLHAALHRPVLAAGEPGTVAHPGLAHARQIEAAPLARWRQARFALAGELKCQDLLRAAAVADDVRTKLPAAAVVGARDLLLCQHRLPEQVVVRRCHATPPPAASLPLALRRPSSALRYCV